ncbi:MAG: hypothetical protein JXR70_12135 [Spirochaetales bacterium]|nr:hypothetical protein [Spirochaetales bacterium]
MNCKEYKEFTEQWLTNGKLAQDVINKMETHLAACPLCREESRSFFQVINSFSRSSSLDQLPQDIMESDLRASIMAKISNKSIQFKSKKPFIYRITAVAASLIIIFGAVFGVITLQRSNQSTEVIVCFTLYAPEASTVSLVGDFTDWHPLELDLDQQGNWIKSIGLKPEQSYLYNFLINGQTWIPDPQADMNIDDGFGGKNSVINL